MSHEVVAALIIQSQQILLGKRSAERKDFPEVWDVFGGHIQPGEDQHETLGRELEEELGITPTQSEYLETRILSYPTYPAEQDEVQEEWTAHLYRVTAWNGTPDNRQPKEHSAIGWFSLSEASELYLADPIYPTLFARYLASK